MSKEKQPGQHYQNLKTNFPEVIAAVENLGGVIKAAGPIDKKTAELIGLAVAAASQSVGSVQSHTRRALEAGASKEEIQHALILQISTIGFPKVAAALSWCDKFFEQ